MMVSQQLWQSIHAPKLTGTLSCLTLVVLFTSQAFGQQRASQLSYLQFGHSSGYQVAQEISQYDGLGELWSKDIGDGRSQIVGDAQVVFVASGIQAEQKNSSIMRVQALRYATGEKLWEWQDDSELRGNQQTFGGAFPSPQATPLLTPSHLIVLSFTGELTCLDRKTGQLKWQVDLVERYQAEPVQFGFSSSPVTDPSDPSAMLVFAAGKNGGLMKMSIENGKLFWKLALKGPSYASPVQASFGGQKQWIVVSEDGVHGVHAGLGIELWSYALPEKGLTNVPTPLVVDDRFLVISGQGVKGTRCLEIMQQESQWRVRQRWENKRIQFFYTNWLIDDNELLWGCTSDYLAVLSIKDGKTLARVRGYGDGNIINLQKQMLVLGGKGKVSYLEAVDKGGQAGIEVTQQYQTSAGRCWTSPTIIGDRLFIRSGKQVHCLSWNAEANGRLANKLKSPRRFELAGSSAKEPDPVEQIFAAFQKDGKDAALILYSKLRNRGKLNLQARIDLVTAAQQQGLQQVAAAILEQAIQDFPNADQLQSLKKPAP